VSLSSVPSPESFIKSFPHQITPIQGIPTYEALNETKTLLKANAASVPSHRGGGANGYLGMIVSAVVYTTIDARPFTLPPNPGAHPVIPSNTTVAVIAQTVCIHAEALRKWREYTHIQGALKKQLVSAIKPIYLMARRDCHVGFNNVTMRELLLAFLFATCRQITPQDLQTNQQCMLAPWDASTPFELLINQIEEAQDAAGNQPFSAAQIINMAYTLVFNTGLYFVECKTWNSRPAAKRN
jgi:hypothetical protein